MGLASPAPEDLRLAQHQRELALAGRCGHCAERVPRVLVLRAAQCPHCASLVVPRSGDAAEVVRDLVARWRRRRLFVYAAVGVAALLTGFVPLAAALLRLVGLVVLHVVLVGRPLRWLSLPRRLAAQVTLKLLLAVLAVGGLLLDVLVASVPVLNAVVACVVTLALTALYVEGALRLIQDRLRRETESPGLGIGEWALPAILLALLAGAAALLVAVAVFAYAVLFEVALPALVRLGA